MTRQRAGFLTVWLVLVIAFVGLARCGLEWSGASTREGDANHGPSGAASAASDRPPTVDVETSPTDRVSAASFVVEVMLPDGITPAEGAVVHAVAGAGASAASREGVSLDIVESCGELRGRTDSSGRLSIDVPGPSRVSARLGTMYAERAADGVDGLVSIVLVDDYSPWIQVVDDAGQPLASVEVKVVSGRSRVHATASTDQAGLVRFHHVWPRGDEEGRRVRVLLAGHIFWQELHRQSSALPIVFPIGPLARLAVVTHPQEQATQVSVRPVVEGSSDPSKYRPSTLHLGVTTQDILVAVGDHSFVVTGNRDGRTVSAPKVVGLLPNERREVLLDFSGREVRGRLLGLDPGAEVSVFLLAGDAWHARQVEVGVGGAFSFLLNPDDVRLVFATEASCSDEFACGATQPTFDLGDVAMAPRPVLGVLRVHDEAGAFVTSTPYLRQVMGADGSWRGFRWRAPIAFRAGPAGIEVLGVRGAVAARVSPHLAGCYALPDVVEVRDGATVTCRLARGATVEVWLADPRDFGNSGCATVPVWSVAVRWPARPRRVAGRGSKVFHPARIRSRRPTESSSRRQSR
jgi:hypothetical protein